MNFACDADRELLQSILPASLVDAVQHPEPPIDACAIACEHLTAAITAVKPFIPSPVVEQCLTSPEHMISSGRYLNGTLVAVDIVGFTSLATRLTRDGRHASEQLTMIINALFALLVAEIHAHGGGIIRFGGAGLTAFFNVARVCAAHTQLAAAAALAMQRRMQAWCATTEIEGGSTLSLRVALHRGKVFATEVGDEQQRALIVAGNTVNRVASILDSAAAHQIVLAEETYRALPPGEFQKDRDLYVLCNLPPNQQPAIAPVTIEPPAPPSRATLVTLLQRLKLYRAYLPRHLPARFLSTDAPGEFRPVTVLFANFHAFSRLLTLLELPATMEHDTAIVGNVLRTYYSHIQQVVEGFGGTVNMIDMTAEGSRFMALFGAPTAHEDDAVRAVHAAFALRSVQNEMSQDIAALVRTWVAARPEQRSLLRVLHGPLPHRIGIASGTVYAGVVGAAERREYTVIGSTVGLAANITTLTDPNTITLTARTQRAVESTIQTDALPPLILPGTPDPEPVFRAVHAQSGSQPAAVERTTPFIGRRHELQQLQHCLDEALSGTAIAGRVAVVVGEAGVGKTRLVEQALADLLHTRADVQIIREVCQSYEQTSPYAPLARIVRRILNSAPTGENRATHAARIQQIEELVGSWQRFVPLLADLADVPIAETELTQALTPEQRHDRLHELLIALLRAAALRQPLVLLIDNAQWADASTCAVLEKLAAEIMGTPLALVLLYRSDAALHEAWQKRVSCTTLTLSELPVEDSCALVAGLLDGSIPQAIYPLLDQAHGSPFFLEQTIRYLWDIGALRKDPRGVWICDRAIDRTTIPAEIEQLVVARIDQLPSEQHTVLEVAAVVGHSFERDLLKPLVPDIHDLDHHLAALVATGLLMPDTGAGHTTFRFKQPLVRDVMYSSLLFAHRRELHGKIAATMEQGAGMGFVEAQAILGEHYYQAEQWERALPYFVQAARHAQARFANSEALTLYQQAGALILLCADPPDIGIITTLYENMGDVLALTGNYEGARSHYVRLLNRLSTHAAIEYTLLVAKLNRKIGNTYEHQGKAALALEHLAAAARQAAQLPSSDAVLLEQAYILSDMGWVHFRQNDLQAAQRELEQAQACLRDLAEYAIQSRILNRLGGVAFATGNIAQAQTYVEQSLAASERGKLLSEQANALNNLGILADSQGLSDDSVRYGRRAMKLHERIGNRHDVAIAAHNVGWTFYWYGDYPQACMYFQHALEHATAIHDTYHQMRGLLGLGRALMALEQWSEAEQVMLQSQFLALQQLLPADQLESLIALAELALHQHQLDAALAYYHEAQPLTMDTQSEEYGRFQRLEARIALAQGDLQKSVQLLEANETFFTELHNIPETNCTKTLLARVKAMAVASDSRTTTANDL